MVMTKAVLTERLCALVPKSKHLVTYHGVLAPASGLRSRVVPQRLWEAGEAGCKHGAAGGVDGSVSAEAAVVEAVLNIDDAAFRRQQAERKLRERLRVSHGGGKRRGARRRYPWAALLQRAYGIEVLVCGLLPEVPEQAACRAPPSEEAVGDDGKGVAE